MRNGIRARVRDLAVRDRNFNDPLADCGRYGIGVHAIHPAIVWTPMLEPGASSQGAPEIARQDSSKLSLLGYCPDGDAIADAAAFLLSDEAPFITG